MKNKSVIFIFTIFVLIVVSIIIVFINMNKTYRNELSIDKKVILAEKSYINFAWGFNYSGMAIFNDGTIYEWNFVGNRKDYDVNNLKEYENWILQNGSKVDKKVTKKDLNRIKKNIKNLENNIESENTAYDAGSSSILVWNDNKEKIILKESGDNTGENKSNVSQELIKIIDNYLD